MTPRAAVSNVPASGTVIVNIEPLQTLLGVGCSAGTNSVTANLNWTAPGGTAESDTFSKHFRQRIVGHWRNRGTAASGNGDPGEGWNEYHLQHDKHPKLDWLQHHAAMYNLREGVFLTRRGEQDDLGANRTQ